MRLTSGIGFGVLLVLVIASPAGAKCARLRLDVTGEVRGDPGHELTIRLEADPAASANQPAPVREGDAFTATLFFDPTKGYSPREGHDCSREPRAIRILLLKGEELRSTQELSFAKDFVEESPGKYRAREPVILDAGSDTKTP